MTKKAVMLSWAIAVVGEFDTAGRRIPVSVVQLLPMVDVVLWAKDQARPVKVEALQAEFNLSRATAYRWLEALRDIDDPTAARGRLPELRALSTAMWRNIPVDGRPAGAA